MYDDNEFYEYGGIHYSKEVLKELETFKFKKLKDLDIDADILNEAFKYLVEDREEVDIKFLDINVNKGYDGISNLINVDMLTGDEVLLNIQQYIENCVTIELRNTCLSNENEEINPFNYAGLSPNTSIETKKKIITSYFGKPKFRNIITLNEKDIDKILYSIFDKGTKIKYYYKKSTFSKKERIWNAKDITGKESILSISYVRWLDYIEIVLAGRSK